METPLHEHSTCPQCHETFSNPSEFMDHAHQHSLVPTQIQSETTGPYETSPVIIRPTRSMSVITHANDENDPSSNTNTSNLETSAWERFPVSADMSHRDGVAYDMNHMTPSKPIPYHPHFYYPGYYPPPESLAHHQLSGLEHQYFQNSHHQQHASSVQNHMPLPQPPASIWSRPLPPPQLQIPSQFPSAPVCYETRSNNETTSLHTSFSASHKILLESSFTNQHKSISFGQKNSATLTSEIVVEANGMSKEMYGTSDSSKFASTQVTKSSETPVKVKEEYDDDVLYVGWSGPRDKLLAITERSATPSSTSATQTDASATQTDDYKNINLCNEEKNRETFYRMDDIIVDFNQYFKNWKKSHSSTEEKSHPSTEEKSHPLTEEKSYTSTKEKSYTSIEEESYTSTEEKCSDESDISEETTRNTLKTLALTNSETRKRKVSYKESSSESESSESESSESESGSSVSESSADEDDDSDYKCDKKEHYTTCVFCKKNVRRALYYIHISRHAQYKPYLCDICSFESCAKSDTAAHFAKVHKLAGSYCKKCLTYYDSRELKVHICVTNKLLQLTAVEDMAKRTISSPSGVKKTKAEIQNAVAPNWCNVCQKKFHTQASLFDHLLVHIRMKRFLCNQCGRAFYSNSDITTHVKKYHKKKPLSCDKCLVTFITHKTRGHHICLPTSLPSIEELTKQVEMQCKKKSSNPDTKVPSIVKAAVAPRIVKKASLAPRVVKKARCESESNMKETPAKTNSKNCDFCRKEFHLHHDLYHHLLCHAYLFPYKCNECGFQTASRHNCYKHIVTHSNGEPYYCSNCVGYFIGNDHFLAHTCESRKHLLPKIIELNGIVRSLQNCKIPLPLTETTITLKCYLCQQSFSKHDDFIEHVIQDHSDENLDADRSTISKPISKKDASHRVISKPIPKKDASRRLISKPVPKKKKLQTEINDGSKITDQYQCQVCGYKAKIRGHFYEHLLIHAELKLYSCGSCDSSFRLNRTAFYHMKQVHKISRPIPCEQCLTHFASAAEFRSHKIRCFKRKVPLLAELEKLVADTKQKPHKIIKAVDCNKADNVPEDCINGTASVCNTKVQELSGHSCEDCGVSCSSWDDLKTHLVENHSGDD